MRRITIALEFTAAFHKLLECGEETASKWLDVAFADDDLFVRVIDTPPKLTVVPGGAL